MFTFAVPYRRFEEMEANVEKSFLKKRTWKSLTESYPIFFQYSYWWVQRSLFFSTMPLKNSRLSL
jgi:hypothetical protein